MIKNKASGAVRCRHRPQARPGGGVLPTPSEPRGSYTRKRRDDPADDAPGRPFTARPASPPCNEPPRTRGPVRRATCLFSTDPRPRRQARPRTWPAPTGFALRDRLASAPERPQARRRQVLLRTAWPPVSTTGAAATEARHPSDRRRTARPGKGRHRPQTRHTRRHPCQAGGCIGARPDASAYCLKSDPNPSSGQPGCRSKHRRFLCMNSRSAHNSSTVYPRNCPQGGAQVDLTMP